MRLLLVILMILMAVPVWAAEKENLYYRKGALEERKGKAIEQLVIIENELTQIYQRIGQIEAQEKVDKTKEEKKGEK